MRSNIRRKNMSLYFVKSEYDLDLAVDECVKLMSIKHSRVKVGFNNMGMVKIFMHNLGKKVDEKDIDPSEMDFHVDVLVGEPNSEDNDEEVEYE